jgi:tripartite-type tricarboxylate transporter receptor subunit TctC
MIKVKDLLKPVRWHLTVVLFFVAVMSMVIIFRHGDQHGNLIPFNYSGKTVTVLVGAGPSGGTSIYGHLVKQFLGKHLPGNPEIIVKNKQGGGGIKMGNLLASGKIDSTEGTVIALFPGAFPLAASSIPTSSKMKYGPSDFVAVGALLNEATIVAVRADSNVYTVMDLRNQGFRWGASGKGASPSLVPEFLNRTFGTDNKVVYGYRGSGSMIKSIATGETDGVVLAMSTLKKKEKIVPLRYIVAIGSKDLIPEGIPDIQDYLKDEKSKVLWGFFSKSNVFARTFVVHKSTPPEAVSIITSAFLEMMNDPEFIKFTTEKKLPIGGGTVADANEALKFYANIDPDIRKQLLEMIR